MTKRCDSSTSAMNATSKAMVVAPPNINMAANSRSQVT